MSASWFRLWHDMPTDPKWRTIAKASGESIANVIAVYLHILVNASNANERGRTHSFVCEDVASALDIEAAQVEEIIKAMQGRVIDGDVVLGWSKRQPNREDGAAERAKAWRERNKWMLEAQANANERERTQANAQERPDSDSNTDTEKSKKKEREKTTDAPADLFPASPATPARRSPIELRTWLDSLPEDEDPIQADDPIIAYAEQAGIRHDWLVLCWSRFKADMIERKTKKRDWRAHFRNAVRANWYRLWWIKDGQSGLTTMGEQERRAA